MSALQNVESQSSDVSARGQRRLRACDSCHMKKIKCDGAKPQCNWCMHHNIPCVFSRKHKVRRRTEASRKLRERNLVQRMERIENLLAESFAKLEESPSDPLPPRASPSPNDDVKVRSPKHTSVGRIYSVGYRLGDINLFHGVPFLSLEGQRWIGFRTEETGTMPELSDSQRPLWQNQLVAWPSMNGPDFTVHEHMPKLPPRTHVQQYFDAYRNSPISSIFPIADPVLFPAVVDKAYEENGQGRIDIAIAKACVFSFLAFVSAISNPHDGAFPVINIEESLIAIEVLFPEILNARARPEVVDAMIMLAVYQFSYGHIQTADIILTLASRFLYMLGAHLYPGEDIDGLPTKSPNLEIRTKLHLREMFWLCYTLDREITFRTGRPPIISDTSCDLIFPKYYSIQNAEGFKGLIRLPGDLGLSLIKSKAYEKLYSPHAMRKPDAEILKDIRELDDLLENWRQSLPSETRPPLSFAQEANQLPIKGLTIPSFMLRMEYHHCITTIHQASSRCRNWSHDRLVNEGLSSSLDLALEASRSLLSYLHFAEHLLVPNLFWVVIFYPISAVLTLFCNILLNPATQSAASDAQSLREVLKFVETFFHRSQVIEKHLQHMKRLNEFLAELVEMAGSAIEQVRRSPECNTP